MYLDGAGFVQIFVRSSVEECLRRNATRRSDELVTEQVVRDMANKFEPPDPSRKWEQHLVVIDNNESGVENIALKYA